MNNIVQRDKDGIKINTLDLEILLGNQFKECKTEKEIDFVRETISDALDLISEERTEELDNE